jgi:hypothetical protein
MMAVVIATPAEGPSFGTAPSGTWIWMSFFGEEFVIDPIFLAIGADVVDAIVALSFITSPSLPVKTSPPLPGK